MYPIHKNVIRRYFIIFFIVWYSYLCSIYGQTKQDIEKLYKSFDQQYGLDPWLINGVKYIPEHPAAYGIPFWLQKEPFFGTLVLNGKEYKNLQLLFNSFKQEFVIQYIDYNNSLNSLVINNANIDTVKLNNSIFVPNKIPTITAQFIQLIYSDSLSCFSTWEKNYTFINSGPQPGFYYSKDFKSVYFLYQDKPMLIKNFHTVFDLFDKEEKKKLKQYIHQKKLRFKKISDEDLTGLVSFSNSLNLK